MRIKTLGNFCGATVTALVLAMALTSCVQAKSVPSATNSARPSASPSASSSASASPGPDTPGAAPSGLPASPSAAPSPKAVASSPALARATLFSPGVSWNASGSVLSGSAFVTNVSESGGTCVMLATLGGVTVKSAPVSSEPDASTTVCGTVTIPGSQLRAGSWAVKFTYVSTKYAGESNSENVQIP